MRRWRCQDAASAGLSRFRAFGDTFPDPRRAGAAPEPGRAQPHGLPRAIFGLDLTCADTPPRHQTVLDRALGAAQVRSIHCPAVAILPLPTHLRLTRASRPTILNCPENEGPRKGMAGLAVSPCRAITSCEAAQYPSAIPSLRGSEAPLSTPLSPTAMTCAPPSGSSGTMVSCPIAASSARTVSG